MNRSRVACWLRSGTFHTLLWRRVGDKASKTLVTVNEKTQDKSKLSHLFSKNNNEYPSLLYSNNNSDLCFYRIQQSNRQIRPPLGLEALLLERFHYLIWMLSVLLFPPESSPPRILRSWLLSPLAHSPSLLLHIFIQIYSPLSTFVSFTFKLEASTRFGALSTSSSP